MQGLVAKKLDDILVSFMEGTKNYEQSYSNL